MTAGGHKHRGAGSLKEAEAALVAANGGQKAASEFTRVGKSQINRYTDDSDDNQFVHMPVDIQLALEKRCGEPLVTRYLAAAQGYAVVNVGDLPPREPYAVVLARIGAETGKLFSEGCKHLAAGKAPRDAGRLKREALALIVACTELLRDIGEET